MNRTGNGGYINVVDKRMPMIGDKVWVIYEDELTEETVEFIGADKFILAGYQKYNALFGVQFISNKGSTWFYNFEDAQDWLLSKYGEDYTLVEEEKTWYRVEKL